jgi:hypothetical protein
LKISRTSTDKVADAEGNTTFSQFALYKAHGILILSRLFKTKELTVFIVIDSGKVFMYKLHKLRPDRRPFSIFNNSCISINFKRIGSIVLYRYFNFGYALMSYGRKKQYQNSCSKY